MKLGIAAAVAWDDDSMGLACEQAEYPRQRIIRPAPESGVVVKGARKPRLKMRKI